MSFNTDWDVEQYKTEHESEEHWELRKRFMLAHKDEFPEERLVCLAQVFFNVEFLGCRYPLETMKLVAELSKGVADEFREQKQGKLQRTFVQASDAAGAKAKGLKRPAQESAPTNKPSPSSSNTQSPAPNKTIRFCPATDTEKQDAKPTGSITTIEQPLQDTFMPPSHQGTKIAQVTFGPLVHPSGKSSDHRNNSTNGSPSRFDRSRYGGVQTYHIDQTKPSKPAVEPISYGPFGKLVLIEPAAGDVTAMETVHRSATVCKVKFDRSYVTEKSGVVACTISLDGKFLATGRDIAKKAAARAAAEVGLEILKESCYTIKVKHSFVSDSTIDKTLGIVPNKSDSNASSVEAPVSDNNIGNKLLRLMGWTGGGLGKDEQGIKEPVQVEEHVNRAGLGLPSGVTNQHQFKQKVFKLMKDYLAGDSSYDLVFSSEFTVEERKIMHEVATNLKLKTKSYGKSKDRHLVVFKRKEMWETLEHVLQSGGSTEKYDLVKPSGPRSC